MSLPFPAGLRRRTARVIDDEPEVACVLARMAPMRHPRARDRVPEIDGPTLSAWLDTRKPHLRGRVVFVTADALGQAASSFLASSGRPVLEKPFIPDKLRQVLRSLGEAAAGPGNN